MDELGWLTIREMANYHSVVQLWKLVRMKKPTIISEKFTINENEKVSTSYPRLQFTELGYRWRATQQWNILPMEIRCNMSLPSFKRQVKSWIKSQRNQEPD